MFENLSNMQRIVGIVVLVVGVAGWVVAFASIGATGGLESELMVAREEAKKAKADLALVSDNLSTAQEALEQQKEASDNLEQLTTKLDAGKADLAALISELEETKAQLEPLRAEVHKQQQLVEGSALKFRTKTRAKVRMGPSTETEEVAVVPEGNSVQVFEIVEDGTWYKVGGMGYIFHELLEPLSDN